MFAWHLFVLLTGCFATIAAAPFWQAQQQQQSTGSYAVAPPPQQVAQQCCGNGRVLGQHQRVQYAGKQQQQYANHQAGYEGQLRVAQQQNVAPQHPQPTGYGGASASQYATQTGGSGYSNGGTYGGGCRSAVPLMGNSVAEQSQQQKALEILPPSPQYGARNHQQQQLPYYHETPESYGSGPVGVSGSKSVKQYKQNTNKYLPNIYAVHHRQQMDNDNAEEEAPEHYDGTATTAVPAPASPNDVSRGCCADPAASYAISPNFG